MGDERSLLISHRRNSGGEVEGGGDQGDGKVGVVGDYNDDHDDDGEEYDGMVGD